MNKIIPPLALLCLSMSSFAEVTIDDLPYLEGTPLVERQNDIPVWSILDYEETDGVVQWAWLDKAGYSAYVVYPSVQERLLPDNSSISANENMMTLRFTGENQEYTFTRYGLDLKASGDEIIFSYITPNNIDPLDEFSLGDIHIRCDDIQLNKLEGNFRSVTIEASGTLSVRSSEHPSVDATEGNNAGLIIGIGDVPSLTIDDGVDDVWLIPPDNIVILPSCPEPSSDDAEKYEGKFLTCFHNSISTVDEVDAKSSNQTVSRSKGGSWDGLIMLFISILLLGTAINSGKNSEKFGRPNL